MPSVVGAKPAVYRLYDGSPRPAAEVVVLRGAESGWDLVAVDGMKAPGGKRFGAGWNSEFTIELLPGPHTLEVNVRAITRGGIEALANAMTGYRPWSGAITFTAVAAHEYRLEATYLDPVAGRWTVSITDLTAGTFRKWSTAHPEGQDSEEIAREAQEAARARMKAKEIVEGGPCPETAELLLGTDRVLVCHCPAERTVDEGFTFDRGVWGTDVYTSNSLVCPAALHAGVIGPGGGMETIQKGPWYKRYEGSSRNGVKSRKSNWTSNAVTSFRFERPPPTSPPELH
jgi:hypothetical protein